MNDFLEFLFLYGGGRLEASVVPPVVHPPIFWRQPAPMKPGQGLLWAWTGLLGTGPGPLSNGTLLPGLTLLPVWGLERPTWDRAWSTPKRDFIIATPGFLFVFAVLAEKKISRHALFWRVQSRMIAPIAIILTIRMSILILYAMPDSMYIYIY